MKIVHGPRRIGPLLAMAGNKIWHTERNRKYLQLQSWTDERLLKRTLKWKYSKPAYMYMSIQLTELYIVLPSLAEVMYFSYCIAITSCFKLCWCLHYRGVVNSHYTCISYLNDCIMYAIVRGKCKLLIALLLMKSTHSLHLHQILFTVAD